MYLGIDLGTSGVKTIVLNEYDHIVAKAHSPLTVSRPHPRWSEQDPEAWWQATCQTIEQLKSQYDLSDIRAIGLSGQMHGAVLLGKDGNVLRPAILWNDGRSFQECVDLEAAVPGLREITGNLAMPGFTAPKLLWVKKHEPELFPAIHHVLLPKDYLRYRLTGTFASDCSDSSGTLWFDVQNRCWSVAALAGCHLKPTTMPEVFEGSQATGIVRQSIANQWGIGCVPVAAGAGDNAAGAIGVGAIAAGEGILSLGTSGVIFVVDDQYRSNPEQGVHSFCHALPGKWHLMSVMLSAASCLDWLCELTGAPDVTGLIVEAESVDSQPDLFFLPYLCGERTPHNNPKAAGVFFGMNANTRRSHLTRAVLEGVGYGLKDGLVALRATGIQVQSLTLIGGGAKSALWRQMLADILDFPLKYSDSSDVGPALGAARLARLSLATELTDQKLHNLCPAPEITELRTPNPDQAIKHAERHRKFQRLYKILQGEFGS